MEIGWILAGFFIFCTMVFIAIAFFLPEWVGITGKRAKDIIRDQQENSDDQDPPKNSPNHP
ncbi:MAG: hypothetical protein AABY64_05755 [Bdellovibrionota bacterium]